MFASPVAPQGSPASVGPIRAGDFSEIDVVGKKKAKLKRAPGGGRKTEYGEPTERISFRLPLSVVAMLRELGGAGGANGIAVQILRDSVQYRLMYGSGDPSDVE
jgi:hypothetical protein